MGTFTIEVEDVKYGEFLEFCKLNSIVPEEFIFKAFIEKYAVTKYGDLNEKVSSVEKAERKKTGKPEKHKKAEENPVSGENEKEAEVCSESGPPVPENKETDEAMEPKRKTRIIKSR